MKKEYSYIIIGAGLTGGIIARILADSGNVVRIIERRDHLAGNMYDFEMDGIKVQKYGPHVFHTNSDKVYKFITKYTEVESYKTKCEAVIDGISSPSPFNYKTIDQFYSPNDAKKLKGLLIDHYGTRPYVAVLEMLKCEDDMVREYANFLFEKDYRLYTSKQWNLSPEEIDPSVLERVPIVLSYRDTYFDDKYEFIPTGGFLKFYCNLIDSPNIDLELEQDALAHISFGENEIYYDDNNANIIYTGAIDELFDFKFGELPYRSLRFEFKRKQKKSFQNVAIVAYPQEKNYTRITEYTKMPYQESEHTIVAVEYPTAYDKSSEEGKEPYYPVLTDASKETYLQYKNYAGKYKNLTLCGRLADFKYYNMDDAVLRALDVAEKIKAGKEMSVRGFEFRKLDFKDAYIINPFYATDERGSLIKDYNIETFRDAGIDYGLKETFYTSSKRGVIRGIHFQLDKPQPKLMRCVSGYVWYVIVDLRPDSETFGQWRNFELRGDEPESILVPAGFGQGYLVLQDAIMSYKAAEVFYDAGDAGIMYNDSDIGIKWPMDLIGGEKNLIISEKDLGLMSFEEYRLRISRGGYYRLSNSIHYPLYLTRCRRRQTMASAQYFAA